MMEDYKNILEGTRPFFQGLPIPVQNPNPPPRGTTPTSHHSPMSLPQNSPQSNTHRMKFEEGLGATLSQMYSTVSSPTLRIPASSSSPKNGPSPSGGPSPGSRERDHHLNLRGGSSASIPPSPSPVSSVLNIPTTNTLPSPNSVPRTNSGSGQCGGGGPGMGIRRESPLDLSVKTVRQSADSSTNNNLPEGSVTGSTPLPPPPQQSSGVSNCVVNSTGSGSGTRSLSSSGASTPNTNNAGNTVIAAVANSTTGREKEKIPGQVQPQLSHNAHKNPAETVPPPQSSQTVMASSSGGYPVPPQNHHLFGNHYHSSPSTVLNIPGSGSSSGHDPSKIYGHHYLGHATHAQQTSSYRLPTPSQHATGSHNFQTPPPPNGGSSSSGSTTTTTTTTTTPSRSSSVIPPYNPAQPHFGLGPYHHQQPATNQLTPHHPYHPHYGSYHIQQPGPGPGQSPHPYYSGHYAASPAHVSHPATSTSSSVNSQPTSLTNRTSGDNHLNQKAIHEPLPTTQPGSTPIYQSGSSTPAYKPGSSTPAYQQGSSTPTYQQGSSTPAYQPESSTPAYLSGSATPAYQPGSSTPGYKPGSSTPLYQAGLSTPAYRAGSSTPGYKPGSSTPAYQAGSSTPAYKPGSSTPAYQSQASTPAYKPGSSTPAYQSGSSTPAYKAGSSTPAYQTNHATTPSTGSKSSQLYGNSQVQPAASPAHYPSYPQYFPHLGIEGSRTPAAGQSPARTTNTPGTPRRDPVGYPLSYPYAHAQSPAHYNSGNSTPNYPNPYPSPSHLPPAGRTPHPNHYYSYIHPGTPRPIPPPQSMATSQSSLPTGYPPYSSQVGTPRSTAPPPAGSQTPTYSSSIQTPLNVPTPKSSIPNVVSVPPSKSPGKNLRANGTPKTGEKRKTLLNLLRNSLETRIHEKQEKEKSGHRQTWNFHGKKYHNPLPPPPITSGMNTTGGAGGSILTGMSHQSHNENQTNSLGSESIAAYPGLFGINQRTNFVERQAAQGALSPNTENSLNRIRTKAEKKQVFPNLLSQIEQENANKHLQSPFTTQLPPLVPPQPTSVIEKYKKYTGSTGTKTKTSVFDFQDEEEEARVNLSMSRRSPGHSTSPVASISSAPPSSSTSMPPAQTKRRSGSKKFTSKLNKWVPPIGIPGGEKGKLQGNLVPGQSNVLKGEISVVPVPTTTSYGISSSSNTEIKRVPAIDNIDEFWATCDSFLDDLSANPTSIKSRRGGLWAKLKSTPKEGKKGKMRRRRRLSAEVDADFQIEEDENGEEGEKEGVNSGSESDSESDKSGSSFSADEEIKGQLTIEEKTDDKRTEVSDEENKGPPSDTRENIKHRKRTGSKIDSKSPKKRKRDSSAEEVKGRKVGKRLLRDRRASSLVGKSVSDLEGSSGESEAEESDVSVASFSISSDDTRSVDSDSSTDSDDSSGDSSDGISRRKSTDSDQSVTSKREKKRVKKKKGRSGSTKGKRKLERRRSTRNSSLKSSGKRNGSVGSVAGKDDNSKKRKRDKRKLSLRPTRNCAKGKLREISGESEEERGSSGEEWIMRGELGKRKREKSRIVYGDGSEFRRPGWEEELIDFKKKLRMPTKLIRVAKPSSLSSTPIGSGKGKEDQESPTLVQPTVVISPAKSTKENKSPTKAGSQGQAMTGEVEVPPVHVVKKGRPPKIKTPVKDGDVVPEKGKKLPKTPKGKKGEKSSGKTKGKKKGGDNPVNGDSPVQVVSLSILREDRDKGMEMLPTPGPAGIKFNKKMSIKSVFGLDIPTPPTTTTTTINSTIDSVLTQQSSPLASHPVPPKKAMRRNKFKSGFDYIRKKKKANTDGSLPPPPKRPKVSQEKNMTEDDVQNELRGWVLNKGLGETVLHRAARLGYPDVAAYTLEHDICSPNCKDNAGYSPLHETCMKGNLEVAKILLAYGANPSQAAPGGIRPLHEACENGHMELVRLLISFGADPLLATYAGQTPIELAEHHKPVKRLLEQHIRDVQGKEEKPWDFRGTGKWADEKHDSGFDVTDDPPLLPSETTELDDGFEFEASEVQLPPIYMLKGDVPYILLQDLINFLGLPKSRILKSHPGAEYVELNSNDFLEDVRCRSLLGFNFRVNLSHDLILIKYDDVIKKMLNIETCFIK